MTVTPTALTVVDLAQRWCTSRQAIRNMIIKGRLPAFEVGTGGKNFAYRIPISEVKRIEKCQEVPQESQDEQNQDNTEGDGVQSGETIPDIPAELLDRSKSKRGRSARPG